MRDEIPHPRTHLQNSMYHPVLCKNKRNILRELERQNISSVLQYCCPELLLRAPLRLRASGHERRLAITNCGRVARNHFAEPSVQPAVQSSRGVQILNNAHILAHNKKKASSDVLWRVKMKSSHGNTPVRYRKRKEVYRKKS